MADGILARIGKHLKGDLKRQVAEDEAAKKKKAEELLKTERQTGKKKKDLFEVLADRQKKK